MFCCSMNYLFKVKQYFLYKNSLFSWMSSHILLYMIYIQCLSMSHSETCFICGAAVIGMVQSSVTS